MRKLLRPQTALLLLGSAPRVTAGVLRLAGGALRLLAERLDPGEQSSSAPEQPTQKPAPNLASRNGADRRGEQSSAPSDTGSNGRGHQPSPRPTSVAPAPPSEPTPPAHVSEEAELVAEFADPGAEDGAGAVVHVEAPWSGYEQMHADEIIDRLAAEPDTVVAVVELYEQTHRRRRTVLEAAPRELRRRANRPGGRRG